MNNLKIAGNEDTDNRFESLEEVKLFCLVYLRYFEGVL